MNEPMKFKSAIEQKMAHSRKKLNFLFLVLQPELRIRSAGDFFFQIEEKSVFLKTV